MKSELKIKMDKIMIPFKGSDKNTIYSDRMKNDEYKLLEPRSASLKRDILISNNYSQKGSSINNLNIIVHKNKVLYPSYNKTTTTPYLNKLKQDIKIENKKHEFIINNNSIHRTSSISSFNSYRTTNNQNSKDSLSRRDQSNLYYNEPDLNYNIRPSSRSSHRSNLSSQSNYKVNNYSINNSNNYYNCNNKTSNDSYNKPNIYSLKSMFSQNKESSKNKNSNLVYDINRNIKTSNLLEKKDYKPNLCNVLLGQNIEKKISYDFNSEYKPSYTNSFKNNDFSNINKNINNNDL